MHYKNTKKGEKDDGSTTDRSISRKFTGGILSAFKARISSEEVLKR